MKKISFLILLVVTSFYACERSYERTIKGVITNKANGQPMDGVKVLLQDGLGTSDPILGSGNTAPKSFDSTFTDANGRYEVQIKTKSSHGFIYIYKDGYLHAAESVQMLAFKGKSNTQEINLEMNGITPLEISFIKTSQPTTENDELMVRFFYHEDYDYDPIYPSFTKHIGKGPFFEDVCVTNNCGTIGDEFVRFELKYKTNNIWYSRLDSIFVPTSQIAIQDTIYY